MDIYVYGAGKRCEVLIERLKEYKNIQVLGIADSYANGSKYGFDLFDIFSVPDVEHNIPVVISVGDAREIVRINNRLQESGFKNIYWFWGKTQSFADDFFERECLNLFHCKGNVILPSLEVHVADYCNLNCAGCVHYSPLFERVNPEFEKRVSDLEEIKGLVDHVFMLSLLGGEPLLNPDLIRYIAAARNFFPYTGIQLITNGLLLPKLGAECLEALKSNYVTVVISEYEPTHKIISAIRDKLDNACVDYIIRPYDKKQKFNRPLSIVKDSTHEFCCICDGCVGVYDGKIARCPALLYIEQFNTKFNQKLPAEGIYRISDFQDGASMLKKMEERVPLCDHCIRDEIDWHKCNKPARITDFAVLD